MISYFQENRKSFGIIRENKSTTLYFQAKYDIPEIEKFEISCGCLKNLNFDKDTKIFSVRYNAGHVPNHLPLRQTIENTITVIYKNKDTEILTIVGIKTR